MKALVTGFGPFPGMRRNPSQAVVERLAREWRRRRIDLHTRVLPTEYEASARLAGDSIRALRPDICIGVGVAGNARALRLESVARNCGSTHTPDQAGIVRSGIIEHAGPELYRSTLPLRAIRAALLQAGFEVERSDDAGGYVCNHLFYAARRSIDLLGLPIACGFIHLPPAGDSRSIAQLARALEIVIVATLKHARRIMRG